MLMVLKLSSDTDRPLMPGGPVPDGVPTTCRTVLARTLLSAWPGRLWCWSPLAGQGSPYGTPTVVSWWEVGTPRLLSFASDGFTGVARNPGMPERPGCHRAFQGTPVFSLLHKNVINRHRWTTRDELRIAILTWIKRTYHRRR